MQENVYLNYGRVDDKKQVAPHRLTDRPLARMFPHAHLYLMTRAWLFLAYSAIKGLFDVFVIVVRVVTDAAVI